MSAALEPITTRTCLDCKRDFSFRGWRLGALCPDCRVRENLRAIAVVSCARCHGPKVPSIVGQLCTSCENDDLLAAVAKYGSN